MGSMMNAISFLLILMTFISYIPQYYRLVSLRSSAGLSITGTLLNLLIAQVQVCTMYYLFLSAPEMEYGIPIATPPSLRDWLSLSQILVQWVCSLVLFALVIGLPPSRCTPAKVALFFWVLHVLLFILSVFAGSTHPQPEDNFSLFNIIRNINAGIVNPIFTCLAVLAFFFQTTRNNPGYLSKQTLGLQLITFLLLAISWPFRLLLAPNVWRAAPDPAIVTVWYYWVGWACVNNAIIAIGQGGLLLAITRGADNTPLFGETEPLLSVH